MPSPDSPPPLPFAQGNSTRIGGNAEDSIVVSGNNNTVNNTFNVTHPARHRGIPLQMPPLPDHFVERPDHQQAVKDRLLSEDPKVFGTLVVSAIYGLGGIGKSVLAAKLAHDDAIQTRFRDGILWVTLGQNPDLLPLLGGWIQSLGDYDYKPTTAQAASNHLRTLLYDKHALLVVDDVWDPDHLEPFRVGGNACGVLVTTREARIPDAHRYSLDVMSPQQSLELMTQKLSEPLTEAEQHDALAFAERVGYLPLALELAATQIEEGVTWAELFEDFQAEVARLDGLDLYGQEDIPDDAKRRKYSLLACFNLSLKQLSAEQLRQFAWLGVVPEDVSLTQGMASTLWQVTSRQAGASLRQLNAKALLLPGAKQAGNQRTYRLHDLMHDLAQRLLTSPPQPQAEGDLPGLGLTKAEAHAQFLQRYQRQTENHQWHTLPDDGYIHAHLTWHMEQAKAPQAVHQLLQETTTAGRNGWYTACDALGKPGAFANDVARAWQLAETQCEADPAQGLALLWRYGLIRTSLNSMAGNVPAELLGALVKAGVWQPAQGLAYAQQVQNPAKRAGSLAALVPYIPEALLPELEKTIGQIHEVAYRSFALSKLAERFPAYWPDVLSAVGQIQDRFGTSRDDESGFWSRASAIKAIASHLPESLLSEALAITQAIGDEYNRASALGGLAPHLPELWPEALAITQAIGFEYDRARALCDLPPHLPESLLSEALAITQAIGNEYSRALALGALAPHLPEELLSEALAITQALGDESDRALALGALAPHLPEELLSEALAITQAMGDESARARALGDLAPHLPELLSEALALTQAIGDESARARALGALAPHLPELLSEALALTQAIGNEYSRARALGALAPHLPELWPEALALTQSIRSEDARAHALCDLARHLPESLLSEALAITQSIGSEDARAHALSALARHLPESLLSEALAITQSIGDEYDRARALGYLARHLPELWPEALRLAQSVGDESYRASTLCDLVPHLPEVLLSEALRLAQSVGDELYRSTALCYLAPRLPELWPEALRLAQSVGDESYRASTLCDLVPHLPEVLLSEALRLAQSVGNEFYRSNALRYLAPRLPELWPEALRLAQSFGDEHYRASTLCDLAPHLPESLLSEALRLTQSIGDEDTRARVLSYLAQRLPELWPEALRLTQAIGNEHYRAFVLCELALRLPESRLSEALRLTQAIGDESARARALGDLAPHLPEELLSEALALTQAIGDESARAHALGALAEHLNNQQLHAAVDITNEFVDPYYAAAAWRGILPRLEDLQVTRTDFTSILSTLAYRSRGEFIGNLPDLTPTLTRLGGDTTLPLCLQAMRDVCAQWP